MAKPNFLPHAISNHGSLTPTRPAITDGRRTLNFGELVRLAAQFANGARQHERVVLLADKSIELIVAMLGVWRVGNLVFPLDPTIPENRIRQLLERIKPGLVICNPSLNQLVNRSIPSAEVRAIDDIAKLRPMVGDIPKVDTVLQDSTDAYCLFTSGSTGHPKGVVISHGAIASFYQSIAEHYPVAENSRCLNTAPLFFDVSVLDIFFPLYQGAYVYMYTEPVYLPQRLLAVIDEMQVEYFCAVAPLLRLMISSQSVADRFSLTSLRTIMTGADVLDVSTVQKWLHKVPGLTVLNGYGPTEATCVCLVEAIRKLEPDRSTPYPIGRPLSGVSCSVQTIDETNADDDGELLIGGPQLLNRYWDDPEETDRRCLDIQGKRHYRTGDLVRQSPEGSYDFIGRVDDEIKLSGYRIHLAEIRRVAKFATEAEAIVGVIRSRGEPAAIALALEGQKAMMASQMKELRSALESELPKYMMPRFFAVMKKLPRLGSGKIDVKQTMETISKASVDNGEGLEFFLDVQSRNQPIH
jgi:amino acid adenylation domain-containing protein